MVHFNRASSTPTRTTPGKMNLISPLQFYLHNHISTHNNRGQPPTNTGDHNMDRHPNSELGTPDKEQHNGRGEPTLDNYPNIMEQRSTCLGLVNSTPQQWTHGELSPDAMLRPDHCCHPTSGVTTLLGSLEASDHHDHPRPTPARPLLAQVMESKRTVRLKNMSTLTRTTT